MRLALSDGGEVVLLSIDGDRVKLASAIAVAPGTRLAAHLADGAGLRIKVYQCALQGERFSIEGRLLDATRTLRERLARELHEQELHR
jgi:hypothetical protein